MAFTVPRCSIPEVVQIPRPRSALSAPWIGEIAEIEMDRERGRGEQRGEERAGTAGRNNGGFPLLGTRRCRLPHVPPHPRAMTVLRCDARSIGNHVSLLS